MPRNHFHDDYEILFVRAGESNFFVENQLLHTTRGTILLLHPTTLHRSVSVGQGVYERYILSLPVASAAELSSRQTDLLACFGHAIHLQLDEKKTKEFIRLFNRCATPQEGYGGDLRCQSTLIEILIRLGEISASNSLQDVAYNESFERIAPILAYIQENMADPLSLERLANKFFISRQHLCRIFKETTGFTVGEYIRTNRFLYACLLLRQGKSVQETGECAGYGNNAHFIRTFGAIAGSPPGQYARKYRSAEHQ
jgi:AraC-like DNA-binding protein